MLGSGSTMRADWYQRKSLLGCEHGYDKDVEIKVEQPIDPDHPYTITVPVHELSEAVTMFLARLYQLSGLGDGKVPISQCQSSSSRPSQ